MFLIRRGETEVNVQGQLQGRFDSPLTAKGVAQAEAFGRHLRTLIGNLENCLIEGSALRMSRCTIIWSLTFVRSAHCSSPAIASTAYPINLKVTC